LFLIMYILQIQFACLIVNEYNGKNINNKSTTFSINEKVLCFKKSDAILHYVSIHARA